MSIDKKTNYGKIDISLDAIASIAGNAAMNCYGVVDLGSKKSLKDDLRVFLGTEKYTQGIVAKKDKGKYIVNIYIIVIYGVKVNEVVSEVQNQVKYVLEKTFDLKFSSINVYVQGIKRI